jgi:hypothetical protein
VKSLVNVEGKEDDLKSVMSRKSRVSIDTGKMSKYSDKSTMKIMQLEN